MILAMTGEEKLCVSHVHSYLFVLGSLEFQENRSMFPDTTRTKRTVESDDAEDEN